MTRRASAARLAAITGRRSGGALVLRAGRALCTVALLACSSLAPCFRGSSVVGRGLSLRPGPSALSWNALGCARRPGTREDLGLRRSPRVATGAQREAVVEATDLYGTYDELRTLFRIDKLQLLRGQTLAVVGANGCGKSTLLQALAGKERLKGGEIQFKPNARVVMVEQNPEWDPNQKVLEAIYERASSPQSEAVRRFRSVSARGDEGGELEAALDAMGNTDAWQWEERATRMIKELGLADLLDRKMSELSGGEERRVALAVAMVDIDNIDLLILDEPTNHLSTEGCDWLQDTLNEIKGTSVVLVTHDRYFLDEVSDQILELDGMGGAFTHPGSWVQFLTRRAARFQESAGLVQDAKVQLRRAQEWMNRGPSGRGCKNKNQVGDYYDTRARAEEKIASADMGAPQLSGSLSTAAGFQNADGKRTIGTNIGVIGVKDAVVRRPDGSPILNNISFSFPRGSKVGIVGPNGAGKSTFLRAITGTQPLDAGEFIEGQSVRLGFLTQDAMTWADPRQRVLKYVSQLADELVLDSEGLFPEMKGKSPEGAASLLLKSVNFDSSRWSTEVGMLSGGEARRLQLLAVLSKRPNVLILDEPTNDLDAVTVDALERLLQPWAGTVIVVSHDRSLLDGVCNEYVVFPRDGSGKPKRWLGTHSELAAFQKEQDADAAAAAAQAAAAATAIKAASKVPPVGSAAAAASAPKVQKAQLSTKEKMDLSIGIKKLEAEIEKVETEVAEVQLKLEEFCSDADKSVELASRLEKLDSKQAELYEQWEEKSTKLER